MIKSVMATVALIATAATQSTAQTPAPPVQIPFVGVATNVSIGVRDSVEMFITNPNAEIVTAGGVFGGQNLVGRFTAIGEPLAGCAERMVCLQLQGTLTDLETGGFAEGIYTTWSMTMTIDPEGNAVATYVVGPLPTYPASQNGVLQLEPRVDE